jgi:hypothetical protein
LGVNRVALQQLAEDRLLDAEALLAQGRWSGAYYLSGYAVECGLKACIMKYVTESGVIFQNKKYAERCWVHNLEELVDLANLQDALNAATIPATPFSGNWGVAKDWKETSRYEQKTDVQAKALFDAINHKTEAVMQWIRIHW